MSEEEKKEYNISEETEKWLKNKQIEIEKEEWRKKFYLSIILFSGITILIILISIVIFIIFKNFNSSKNLIKKYENSNRIIHLAEFPEYDFPPDEKYSNEYLQRVKVGYRQMKTMKVVIAGLARDIENIIVRNIRKIERLGKYFKDYRIILLENDSEDSTREKIKMIAGKSNKIILLSCLEDYDCKLGMSRNISRRIVDDKRIQRLARLRNRLLNYAKSKYYDFDYLIMIDLDFAGPISEDGFATSFSYKGWDVMTANGVINQLFTSKFQNLFYYDTLSFIPFNVKPRTKFDKKLIYQTPSIQFDLKRGKPPLRVSSAFAGAAIYNMKSLINSRAYYNPYPYFYYSEHASLHLMLKDRGYDHIYINPNWIILHSIEKLL